MANISAIKLPSGNTYNLKDNGALQLTGGQVTGSVTFSDNIQVNTINGVLVGNSPKFTDTNTEVSTLTLTSGNDAGTSLTHGGKFTLTAGSKTVSFTMPSTIATYNKIGLVKPWYSHTAASTGPTTGTNSTAIVVNALTTTSNRYYAVESDSVGRLFVNVPWSIPTIPTTANNSVTNITASTDANKVTVGSHTTDYGIKGVGSGSATFNAKVTNHILAFSFSHEHNVPTLGSKIPTVAVTDATVTITDNGHTHTLS